jgi:hypothetical protein
MQDKQAASVLPYDQNFRGHDKKKLPAVIFPFLHFFIF